MGNFKNKLYRFMYGRYGGDTLNKVLLGVYVGLVLTFSVVSLLVKNPLASLILNICYFAVSVALVVWIFSRILSRNIQKRRRENERFCGFFRLIRNRFRDRKTHVYRKCPKCRAVLRLPKAKGKHPVVCPRCKHHFEVRG